MSSDKCIHLCNQIPIKIQTISNIAEALSLLFPANPTLTQYLWKSTPSRTEIIISSTFVCLKFSVKKSLKKII